MVEENARLSRRLSKTLSRASQHAENYEAEAAARENNYYDRVREAEDRAARAEADLHQAKIKVEEVLRDNRELRGYVDRIKESYVEAFENSTSSK